MDFFSFLGKEAGVQPLQKKPKMDENHQNNPKMGGNCRSSVARNAHNARFVGPNQHCNICDMDFESTAKTVDHILNDHFDVAFGRKDGNKRCVF